MFFRTKLFWRKSEVELDASNYARKVDLKNATDVHKFFLLILILLILMIF